MKITPLKDKVIIKPLEKGEEKKGNIIIPDTAKEKPQMGEVMEVGPGKMTEDGKRLPMDVKKGQKVIYEKYAGTEVTVEDSKLLILDQDSIIGIVE